jgi:hypothetical protein
LAFVFFPVGPYICLYGAGALTVAATITWSVLAFAFFEAHTTAMIFTEGRPEIQGWVLISMVQCMTLVAAHQYALGQRLSLWPRSGLRTWRTMARLAGAGVILLLIGQLIRSVHPEWFVA